MTVVVDTNVILVANQQHAGVSPECVIACAQRLQSIMASGRIALDDRFRILGEYQKKPQGSAKSPGGAFLKWALQNRSNTKRCDLVPIHEDEARGFTEFPNDAALGAFDASDRMFVAVANSHSDKPPILQAADSKWLGWAPDLKPHGVTVEFLCPKDVAAFRKRKQGG